MSQATETTAADQPRSRRQSRPEPFIQPLAYTMDQAAIACGRSKKQLYRDIAQGLLRTYKHGKRRMVTVQEMERHVARLARGQ